MNKTYLLLFLFGIALGHNVLAQKDERRHGERFEQLGPMLRSPNVYRTAAGAPGHLYWQQKADYEIEVTLDDDNQSITGTEKVTYYNNSPDVLDYLWIQLDQNQRDKDSETPKMAPSNIDSTMSLSALQRIMWHEEDYGVKIYTVNDSQGNPIANTINQTMMRLDLEEPLQPGESFSFQIDWGFNIHDRMSFIGGRPGYEFFEEDGNYLYTMAEWFPRMAVYSDFEGWQNKQFVGTGEFALVFGDYKVSITVPADHMVGATGVLQNPEAVLSNTELERWGKAKTSFDAPVIIRTQAEAERLERRRASDTKTWEFHAENVRDFAWTSSRKFIWDAMAVDVGGKEVMAMSYYAKEANPLWEQYSTKVVAHTLKSYSEKTFDYPYPVAISVEATNGMEYPMICFNYGRPDKDGTYSEAIKYGMISVIIHEVGHNFFPMIVNSDERQWTWMDEGLNTFLQFLAEQEWDRDYPSRRGPPHKIVPYMKMEQKYLEPIMTNSENIVSLGGNAYAKAATALNILRETVMGRDLFDYAFKKYSQRWKFKHPTPEDFFRTMEDASAVDLDWFWRGWFYGTETVDISLADVKWYKIDDRNPAAVQQRKKEAHDREWSFLTKERNRQDVPTTVVEEDPETRDFYTTYDRFRVGPGEESQYRAFLNSLNEKEREMLESGMNFYEITLENLGGLVMPVILQFNYVDGTSDVERLPAQIWRLDEYEVTKVFAKEKEVAEIILDPFRETADVDEENNYWPQRAIPSRFELFKQQSAPRGTSRGPNPMRDARNRR
ncbi:M1 family metallopeptidase [Pleomorphovibrio marinus]|uniref:M1 family metallopeptidase n=1 Tax=Pleomorphovibrio marinus TaxID=2164132 RepID=UPI000E0B33B9|nr:M1 family metallopeptidase [Pleomorphovibrio marinus]